MQLKEELTIMQHGSRSIIEYLHSVKTVVDDQFALIDAPYLKMTSQYMSFRAWDLNFTTLLLPFKSYMICSLVLKPIFWGCTPMHNP
jgi:hypothetical protein